ncbi:MAG: hypothetical protein GY697_22090 [Desulfobacterales bacterium]|nr:hypothetical protein [Desulfobacterales bacterium]
MKIRLMCLLLLIPAIFLPACSPGNPESSRVVADINGFKLSQAEFHGQLAAELEFDRDFKLTDAARKDFLEQIIRRELMIQEAQRLKLDRQERFVQTIERYWESTLIRDLLEIKGTQIGKTVVVSQNEVRSRYEMMQTDDEALPLFTEIQDRLMAELREEKKTQMLTRWIDDLRNNAKIAIDDKLLFKD